jgi:hypothetical protein
MMDGDDDTEALMKRVHGRIRDMACRSPISIVHLRLNTAWVLE